jgi:3-oxoadipate enol-lactonase
LRFHCRIEGTEGRPVVVLSNSLGTNLSMWDPQIPALAPHFRVLRYDTRGHGRSAVPPGPYTIETLGRDVIGLLDSLDVERAHFCGLSMGGMTGLWLGIHHPERFQRLALCNTAARVGTPDLWNARIAQVQKGGVAAITAAVLERWFTPVFVGSAPQTVDSVRRMLLESPADGYVACCEALRDADLTEQAARVRAPTLVVSGSRDPAAPPADGRLLASKIPGARYLELESSHLSNIEAAPQFTSALLDFLEAN